MRASGRARPNARWPGTAVDALRTLAEALEPGHAIAAALVEHTWTRALEDAVAQSGGTRIASHFVDAATFSELLPELLRPR